MPAAKIPFFSRLPFLVIALILGVATICVVAVRFTERLPINPWEPAIAMEAVRLSFGQPVYESGHATHIYGPLLTVLLGGLFYFTELNLLAARIVMSLFGFALAIFLSAVLCREKSPGCWLLSFLLFCAISFRTNLVPFSIQPDCAAAFFAVVGLYFWTTRERSRLRLAISIAAFLVAMFFKQTSAAFALIPIAHVLIWKRPVRVRELVVSFVPAASLLLALAVVRFASPQLFWSMVTVPAAIKVYYGRAPGMLFYMVATFPIFLVGLVALFSKRRPIDRRERWICSSLVVLIPISVWTIAKSGGSSNSFLFAYLAMTALFVARFDVVSEWLASLSKGRSAVWASVIALVILFSFFCEFGRTKSILFARHGDDKYDRAIQVLMEFVPGGISPQDPTIAFKVDGTLGRSLFFELDAHAVDGNWPDEVPQSIQEELARATQVIEVRSFVPTPGFQRALIANRFHPLAVPGIEESAYTFWVKGD